MKTFVVLFALAAVAIASPINIEDVEQDNVEADLSKISGGIKCHGRKCKGSINIGGSWYMDDEGTLIPVEEPAKIKIGCRKKHCGISINWFSLMEEINKPEEAKRHVEVGAECHGSKCSGNIKVGVDWFKAEDGSLVGVPRPEVESKNHIKGGADDDWFVAGDETLVPIPKSNVAIFGGRIEVGSQCEGSKCKGILGVKVNWFKTKDGNLVPIVTPKPIDDYVDDSNGSKYIGVEWFVTSDGTVILIPTPAKTHITGGVECHGKHCSGNVGIGVDWFKNEYGNVIPTITPISQSAENEIEYKKEKVPIIPIIPKDMPRVIKPKSFEEE
ncbi:uncharacterized protein LOC124954256 [Vespa velutina]|uniref:uncharacterized protein LOC124954256 n=1 Tax=Vespa velutina TaxID=202808 RepID=UPI001FB1F58C|nr:uncharacterized protein LOC124954256 [Vespa velutina]